MDVILQALDAINGNVPKRSARQPLEPCTPEVLHALHRLSEPESADEQNNIMLQLSQILPIFLSQK